MTRSDQPRYPGMLARVLAFGADYLVVSAYVLVLVGIGAAGLWLAPDAVGALFGTRWSAQAAGFVLLTAPVCWYFASSESSPSGATVGKRALGIRVTRADGASLSAGRAVARTALKFLPWELAHTAVWEFRFADGEESIVATVGLCLVWGLVFANFVAAAMDGRHQALHDRAVDTVVVVAGR